MKLLLKFWGSCVIIATPATKIRNYYNSYSSSFSEHKPSYTARTKNALQINDKLGNHL